MWGSNGWHYVNREKRSQWLSRRFRMGSLMERTFCLLWRVKVAVWIR